jgi:hypothetical protein
MTGISWPPTEPITASGFMPSIACVVIAAA